MPSVYALKSAFQKLLSPAASGLNTLGVTANEVTLAAAITSVAYGAAIGFYPQVQALWFGLPAFLFVRMALNALDGMLARDYGQASKKGAFLNELGDIVSDAALILGFWGLGAGLAAAVFALTAALSEVAGLGAQAICGVRRYDGPFGKSDRAVVLGVIGCLVGLDLLGPMLLCGLLWLCAAGALFTCWQRIAAALREDA